MVLFFSYFSLLLLFISLPCFQARSLSPINNNQYTWHEFHRFVDVEKGSKVTGISDLKKYFHRFGYLSLPNTNFTDTFDTRFESALIEYQSKLSLPITGKLDSLTLSQIMLPRCGARDTTHKFHETKRFTYFLGRPRWARSTPMSLTYAFSKENSIQYLSSSDMKAIFQRAFVRWSSVIPVSFSESENYKTADIKIGFYSGDHGDGVPFDGVLGVLAHAFSPQSGKFHLDAAETWAVDFGSEKSKIAVDLESVATHEIGHVLGLAHSTVKEAIMYPSLRPRTKKVDLKLDDVVGVQALYGSNPNFRFSSLLESDISSNQAVDLRDKWSKWAISLVVLMLGLCI